VRCNAPHSTFKPSPGPRHRVVAIVGDVDVAGFEAGGGDRHPDRLDADVDGRCWCGVVGGNTAKWVVLSEKTSTLAPVGMTIDASAGNVRPAKK
jgi:hypothetical protein